MLKRKEVCCHYFFTNALCFYWLFFLIRVTHSLAEGIGEEADEMPEANVSFRVTLKPSHVDKRQHGVVRACDLSCTDICDQI